MPPSHCASSSTVKSRGCSRSLGPPMATPRKSGARAERPAPLERRGQTYKHKAPSPSIRIIFRSVERMRHRPRRRFEGRNGTNQKRWEIYSYNSDLEGLTPKAIRLTPKASKADPEALGAAYSAGSRCGILSFWRPCKRSAHGCDRPICVATRLAYFALPG